MSEHQFRTAAFGGFHRQDVMDYLVSSAEQHNQELQRRQERESELEKELKLSREQGEKLEDQLSALKEEKEQLSRELEQLRAELAQLTAAHREQGEKLENTAEMLSAAQRELEEERGRVARLAPDAEAYTAIKERTAGVELEAHRRAQSVEARAKIMAGDLQRQMEQWCARVEQQYTGLRGEIDNSVERANQQLLAAGQSLGRVSQLLEEQQATLKNMMDSYSEAVRKKAE